MQERVFWAGNPMYKRTWLAEQSRLTKQVAELCDCKGKQ